MSNTFPSRPHHPHHPHFPPPPPPSYGDPYKPPAPFQPQYIGARYVPVFANPVEWSDQSYYENLTMVMQNGDTYISRVPVPIGTPLDDTKFWLKIGPFSEQLAALTNLIEGWDAKIANNTATAEEAERVANEALKLVQDATGDYTLIKTTVEQHTGQLEALQKQADETQSLAQQNADEISSINQEVTDNKNAITTNSAKIAALEPRVAANETGIADNKAAIEALQTGTADLTQIRQDIADNKQAIGANELAISDMRSDITAQDTKIAAANTSIAQNAKDISDLTSAIGTDETPDTIKGRIKALEESGIPSEDLDKLKADVAGNTAAIDGLNASQAAQDTKITANENAITALQSRATDHDQELEKLNTSLQEVSDNVVKNTETLTGLTDDIASVQQAAEDAQEAAKTATEAAASATEVTEGLKDAVDANTAAIAELPNTYLPLAGGKMTGTIEIPIGKTFVKTGATESISNAVIKLHVSPQDGIHAQASYSPSAPGKNVLIQGVKDPINPADAANKDYVDKAVAAAGVPTDITDRLAAVETTVGDAQSGLVKDVDDLQTAVEGIPGKYLPLTGGKMMGRITRGLKNVIFASDPTETETPSFRFFYDTTNGITTQFAADDTQISKSVTVQGLKDPKYGSDAANKAYVDAAIAAAGVPADIASRLEAVEKDSTENMGDISALQADVAEINGQQTAQDTAISGNTTAINNAVNRIAAVEQGYLPLSGGKITGAIIRDVTPDTNALLDVMGENPTAFFLKGENELGFFMRSGDIDVAESYAAKLGGIATPIYNYDAANKGYVDATAAQYLPLAGGKMTGSISKDGNENASAIFSSVTTNPRAFLFKSETSGSFFIREGDFYVGTSACIPLGGIAEPVYTTDAANKAYVDSKAGVPVLNAASLPGVTSQYHLITNLVTQTDLAALPDNCTQFMGFGQTTVNLSGNIGRPIQLCGCYVNLNDYNDTVTDVTFTDCIIYMKGNGALKNCTLRNCVIYNNDYQLALDGSVALLNVTADGNVLVKSSASWHAQNCSFTKAALNCDGVSSIVNCRGGDWILRNGSSLSGATISDAIITFYDNTTLTNCEFTNCAIDVYETASCNATGIIMNGCYAMALVPNELTLNIGTKPQYWPSFSKMENYVARFFYCNLPNVLTSRASGSPSYCQYVCSLFSSNSVLTRITLSKSWGNQQTMFNSPNPQ